MNVNYSYGFSYSAWASVSMHTAGSGRAAGQPDAAQPPSCQCLPAGTGTAPATPPAQAPAPADADAPEAAGQQPVTQPGGSWFPAAFQSMGGSGPFGVFALTQPVVMSSVFMQLGYSFMMASASATPSGEPAAASPPPSTADQPPATPPVAVAPAVVAPAADRSTADGTGAANLTAATTAAGAATNTVTARSHTAYSGAAMAQAGSMNPAAASDPASQRTVERLDTEAFDRYRLKQRSVTLTTSLQLELETREGDRIVLDFSQMDLRESTGFRGVDADGARVRLREFSEESQRLVSLEITGELSEEERAAIDGVLAQMVDMADAYFGGSMEATVARLNEMDFDTESLLDVSFQMSVSRRMEVSRGYGNAEEGLTRLASRDSEVRNTLEFFADGQRRILESAQEVMRRASAAKMVRALLPAMLEGSRDVERAPRGEHVHEPADRHRAAAQARG